jgi:hypothetical protein
MRFSQESCLKLKVLVTVSLPLVLIIEVRVFCGLQSDLWVAWFLSGFRRVFFFSRIGLIKEER